MLHPRATCLLFNSQCIRTHKVAAFWDLKKKNHSLVTPRKASDTSAACDPKSQRAWAPSLEGLSLFSLGFLLLRAAKHSMIAPEPNILAPWRSTCSQTNTKTKKKDNKNVCKTWFSAKFRLQSCLLAWTRCDALLLQRSRFLSSSRNLAGRPGRGQLRAGCRMLAFQQDPAVSDDLPLLFFFFFFRESALHASF